MTYNEKIYQSETDYIVVESQNNHSIVLVKLLTGRKHQIRKHFFEIGHPILGDNKYKKKQQNYQKQINFSYIHILLNLKISTVIRNFLIATYPTILKTE